MTNSQLAIISVPGIRPKPPVDEHQQQLQRCLHAAVLNAGGRPEEAAAVTALLELIGWSYDFYGEHGVLAIDQPGIERLLEGRDSREDDARTARRFSRRVMGGVYALWDRLPLLEEIYATPRMQTQLREIRRYFNNEQEAGTTARAKVCDALEAAWKANQQVVLMGHSFGSVIAYDVLWEYTHERDDGGDIDLFVTMGSPLTLNFMRSHIKGAAKHGAARYPANINRWVNLTAVGEVTALDRKLSDCFKEMLTLGLVGSIEDNVRLVNQFHGPDGLNVHKCYGYFASPVLGGLLLNQYRDCLAKV